MRRRRRWRSRPIWSARWARSGTSSTRTIPGASPPRTPTPSEIKKHGGEVVGTTGIPLGTADMTPFLSKITGDFDGLFGIFFGKDGVTIGNQAFDLGLTKKYKWAGDGAIAEFDQPARARQQDRGLHRHQPLHPGARGPLNTPAHKKFFDEAVGAAEADRSVGPAARPLRAVELRGDERAQSRHGEVEVPGPRRHHEADRGAGRSGDEGRRRLPAGRQGAAQGGPPGDAPRSSSSTSRTASTRSSSVIPAGTSVSAIRRACTVRLSDDTDASLDRPPRPPRRGDAEPTPSCAPRA